MAQLAPWIKAQFFDVNGINPLSGGQVQTYQAGTTTPQATFTDATGSTPNANPVILDSSGRANIWLSTASYKFVVMDASSNVLYTEDNVTAPSPTGFTTLTIPYASVQASSLTNPVPLFILPPLGILKNICVKHSTQFSGGAISDVVVQVGTSTNYQQFIENFDVFQGTGDTVYDNESLNYIGSFVNSTQIYANFVSVGANLSSLTQGSLTIYYETGTL
jgi:hypothetical protein